MCVCVCAWNITFLKIKNRIKQTGEETTLQQLHEENAYLTRIFFFIHLQ